MLRSLQNSVFINSKLHIRVSCRSWCPSVPGLCVLPFHLGIQFRWTRFCSLSAANGSDVILSGHDSLQIHLLPRGNVWLALCLAPPTWRENGGKAVLPIIKGESFIPLNATSTQHPSSLDATNCRRWCIHRWSTMTSFPICTLGNCILGAARINSPLEKWHDFGLLHSLARQPSWNHRGTLDYWFV